MAATVSSPWGKPGAWALESEEHDAELQQEQQQQQQNSVNDTAAAADFPSLAAAAATKQPKKKKNQTLSLAEFSSHVQQQQQPKRLTHDELLSLPTGPRQRSAEELDRSRLGGGFRSYGSGGHGNYNGGDDSSNSRWGGGNSRVSNRDRDGGRELMPSRADEIDDWGKAKKSTVGNGFDRRERGSFFESHSKADESDSWVSNKASEPPRKFDRRGSFDSLSRGKEDRHVPVNGGGGPDSETWGRRKEESNGTGVGGRPKLVLQPRTMPVSNGNGAVAKPKGSSPFGEARPREEVLAEKGMDHKEIDEKLESMKISTNNKEVEKARKGWSFGSFGSESDGERSWRKPEVVDSGSRPQRFV